MTLESEEAAAEAAADPIPEVGATVMVEAGIVLVEPSLVTTVGGIMDVEAATLLMLLLGERMMVEPGRVVVEPSLVITEGETTLVAAEELG